MSTKVDNTAFIVGVYRGERFTFVGRYMASEVNDAIRYINHVIATGGRVQPLTRLQRADGQGVTDADWARLQQAAGKEE